MKLQLIIKSGTKELFRCEGRIKVSNAQLMKVTQCENLIEELTGYRAHILPVSAPLIEHDEDGKFRWLRSMITFITIVKSN